MVSLSSHENQAVDVVIIHLNEGSKQYIHKQHQRLSIKIYAMQLFVVYRQVSFYTISFMCKFA